MQLGALLPHKPSQQAWPAFVEVIPRESFDAPVSESGETLRGRSDSPRAVADPGEELRPSSRPRVDEYPCSKSSSWRALRAPDGRRLHAEEQFGR